MLLIRPQFITRDECRALVDVVRSVSRLQPVPSSVHCFERRTEVDCDQLGQLGRAEAHALLTTIRDRAVILIRDFYDIEEPLCVDYSLLTEMRPGDAHPRHADNEQRGENGDWVPNHTPWRSHTAMVYLNQSGTDFGGGSIRFTSLGNGIAPEPGLFVGFCCGHEYEHEVTPVERGARYALSIWMTRDFSHAEMWV